MDVHRKSDSEVFENLRVFSFIYIFISLFSFFLLEGSFRFRNPKGWVNLLWLRCGILNMCIHMLQNDQISVAQSSSMLFRNQGNWKRDCVLTYMWTVNKTIEQLAWAINTSATSLRSQQNPGDTRILEGTNPCRIGTGVKAYLPSDTILSGRSCCGWPSVHPHNLTMSSKSSLATSLENLGPATARRTMRLGWVAKRKGPEREE